MVDSKAVTKAMTMVRCLPKDKPLLLTIRYPDSEVETTVRTWRPMIEQLASRSRYHYGYAESGQTMRGSLADMGRMAKVFDETPPTPVFDVW